MEKLTLDLSRNIISQITEKLLPPISKKYNIPLNELIDVANKNDSKDKPIKATPNAPNKATPKTSSKSQTSNVKPKSGKVTPKNLSNKRLNELQGKIDNAVSSDKVFNVSTGRPLADTVPNRRKYKFIDELGIAGTTNDEKLTAALKLLGATTKKDTPIHVQATKAKKRAQINVDDYVEDNESEDEDSDANNDNNEEDNNEEDNESEDEDSDANNDNNEEDNESEDEDSDANNDNNEEDNGNSEEKEEKVIIPVKKNKKKAKVEEEVIVPPKKNKKKNKKPKVEDVVISSKKNVPKKGKIMKKVSEDMDAVVKMSELADEKQKAPLVKYNKDIKQWWNAKTGYVFKRKGIKHFVIGTVNREGNIVPLNEKNLKNCKKLQWATDTTILKDDEESDDTSESDESEED